jgi:hypothetical protein
MNKTLFAIIALLIGISSGLNAQEQQMEIYNTKGDLIQNGASLAAIATSSAEKLLFTDSLLIKNISEETIKLKVRKNNHTIIGNTYSTFNALAQSMNQNEPITPNYWELEPGQSLPIEAVFVGTYFAISGGSIYTGTSTYNYSFLSVDENNQVLDSVYVNYSFSNTSVTPLNNESKYLYNGEVLIDCDPSIVCEYNILLRNHTSETLAYRVGKSEINIEEGQEIYFNFGGVEYAPEDSFSDGTGVSIVSGETLEGANGFKAMFDAKGIDGNEYYPSVKFKFFNRLAGNDADFVTLIYNVSGVGFSELDAYQISEPYPNPASEFISVDHQFGADENAQLKLYNSAGQLIMIHPVMKESKTSVINVSNLPTGMYMMSIEVNNRTIGVEKIVLQ